MRFSKAVVKCRVPILIITLLLMIPAVLGMVGTRINYDMLNYLPSDMDTVIGQWEFDSLDQYFAMERQFFVNPDENAQALIDTMNHNAKTGYKEIYEVVQ